jgi:hypothetical protein
MRPLLARVGLAATLAALPAAAIDDHFDPAKYEKGGFAPVNDEVYAKECGSCHFTYLPGMLPERSWRALMARSNQHFGESLSPETARHIENYLASNASDRSEYDGARLMIQELPSDAAPTRITALPLMRHRHVVVNKLMQSPLVKVHTLTNCDACHETAATGSFAYRDILVPGVSKVVRPGGMF